MNINELQQLYKKSCSLIAPYLQLEDALQKNPQSQQGLKDLNEGIEGLKTVIENNEYDWASQWFLGKAYQALEEHEDSYKAFLDAYHNNLSEQDVLRELALECLLTDRFPQAVYYCNVAVEFSPNDYSLWSNMAVSHLFNKNVQKAEEWASKTLNKIPDDKPSAEVLKYVNGIKNGTMSVPDKFCMFE